MTLNQLQNSSLSFRLAAFSNILIINNLANTTNNFEK